MTLLVGQLVLEVLAYGATPPPPKGTVNGTCTVIGGGAAGSSHVPQTLPVFPYVVTDPEFWFCNANSHAQIIRAAKSYNGTTLTSYPLFPIDPNNAAALTTWLQAHQRTHDDMNAAFGLPSPDITNLKLDDTASITAWNQQHLDGHRRIVVALGK